MAPSLGYKATHPTYGFIFDHNPPLRMSISSLETDLNTCDLEVASIMSSQFPVFEEEDEFRPAHSEQSNAQGKFNLYLPLAAF